MKPCNYCGAMTHGRYGHMTCSVPCCEVCKTNGLDAQPQGVQMHERHNKTLDWRILDYIRGCGILGCTDEEGENVTGISGDSWRPSRQRLQRLGLIEKHGSMRPTASGRRATVWCVKKVIARQEKPKVGRAVLLVEVGDKLHQVLMSENETANLLHYVAALHGGSIKAMESPIESVTLTK